MVHVLLVTGLPYYAFTSLTYYDYKYELQIVNLARRYTRVQSSVISVHRRDIEVRFDVAVGGNELSNLKSLSAVQLVSIELPDNIGSRVAGSHALEP